MSDEERSKMMRVLNIQRCAEAMQLLYQTYIIDAKAAALRGSAITTTNDLILILGGEDTVSKIEAVPFTARLRESGEKDLIELGNSIKDELGKP